MSLRISEIGCGLRLTLDRPDQANAVDDTLVGALHAALREAAQAGARLVVLDGDGRNFCGGFDFSALESCSDGDLLLRFVRIEQVLQLLWNAPFVSVALVHGAAFGAGADLVAASTYRIGAPGCRFRFPGYRFGIALGTRRLGCVVGEQRAREILLANAVLDSEMARTAGLLTQIAKRDDWDGIVAEIGDSMESLDRTATAALLRNVRADPDADARDLAALVRSAAEPGLRGRIAAYRAAAARQRHT
ncbi:enoyl-CoA hydratase/isomerase family protein [Methylobacterium sp. NEAU K]|uniref:enoyl-CoA hydratase/isomerase family protein n=1 Tax=Methylobacterium sp. NEAU K TaxID=3064946 RepID=UPI0027343B1E|nr:enoyl-CoA hydratase/isomerase family protein [Methylobacterium sp. NEAU K]MDP4006949.1 enoyl-CoA hydratase/isomerase family protein [Methylobacterium sp. NEAU K]